MEQTRRKGNLTHRSGVSSSSDASSPRRPARTALSCAASSTDSTGPSPPLRTTRALGTTAEGRASPPASQTRAPRPPGPRSSGSKPSSRTRITSGPAATSPRRRSPRPPCSTWRGPPFHHRRAAEGEPVAIIPSASIGRDLHGAVARLELGVDGHPVSHHDLSSGQLHPTVVRAPPTSMATGTRSVVSPLASVAAARVITRSRTSSAPSDHGARLPHAHRGHVLRHLGKLVSRTRARRRRPPGKAAGPRHPSARPRAPNPHAGHRSGPRSRSGRKSRPPRWARRCLEAPARRPRRGGLVEGEPQSSSRFSCRNTWEGRRPRAPVAR